MSRYLTEFVGTFFLVFTIGCSVIGGTPIFKVQSPNAE
jgi:glycerol uptake facilitator-like aquaporin